MLTAEIHDQTFKMHHINKHQQQQNKTPMIMTITHCYINIGIVFESSES